MLLPSLRLPCAAVVAAVVAVAVALRPRAAPQIASCPSACLFLSSAPPLWFSCPRVSVGSLAALLCSIRCTAWRMPRYPAAACRRRLPFALLTMLALHRLHRRDWRLCPSSTDPSRSVDGAAGCSVTASGVVRSNRRLYMVPPTRLLAVQRWVSASHRLAGFPSGSGVSQCRCDRRVLRFLVLTVFCFDGGRVTGDVAIVSCVPARPRLLCPFPSPDISLRVNKLLRMGTRPARL